MFLSFPTDFANDPSLFNRFFFHVALWMHVIGLPPIPACFTNPLAISVNLPCQQGGNEFAFMMYYMYLLIWKCCAGLAVSALHVFCQILFCFQCFELHALICLIPLIVNMILIGDASCYHSCIQSLLR